MTEDPPRGLTPGGLARATAQSLAGILLAVGIVLILAAIFIGSPS
jgi:hypothetical protein